MSTYDDLDVGVPMHAWQEYNPHGNTCHYPGCTLAQDEHVPTYPVVSTAHAELDYEEPSDYMIGAGGLPMRPAVMGSAKISSVPVDEKSRSRRRFFPRRTPTDTVHGTP